MNKPKPLADWEKPDWDDNPEWTAEDFANARPASELFPPEFVAQMVRKPGRPAKAPADRRVQVSLRISPEVLEYFRATGAGWQGRINLALVNFVKRERKRA